ncbi:MAG TPA: ABC transporter permease [Candidatus Acidoferrales bacterium]|nr:ABC transporter permease [Candidatus Acidoferrales bacterium]
MSWHRLAAIARKEVIQIRRDRRSLIIVVLMPVMLMLLFGYGVSLDLKHTPTCVFDREGSQQSQDLLKRFQASEYFDVVARMDNYPALVEAIDSGQCKLGLVIPHDFSRRLATGGTVGVQALVDATDDNTANLIFSYTEAVIGAFSADVRLDWLRRLGRGGMQVPLTVEARVWFNEELESKAFIVPGVMVIVMAVIGAFLTSLTIAREWERGTMEQLVSTPVTPLEVMLGKLGPYFVIGLFDTALCAAVGIGWFQVPFRGHLSTLFVSSALFLVVTLGLGYFISVITKNQLAASQAALVATFLPAFMLSGFLFAIEQMPAPIRAITHVVPARYFVSLLKDVFLKGSPLPELTDQLWPLAVFALIMGTLATLSFKKRLT